MVRFNRRNLSIYHPSVSHVTLAIGISSWPIPTYNFLPTYKRLYGHVWIELSALRLLLIGANVDSCKSWAQPYWKLVSAGDSEFEEKLFPNLIGSQARWATYLWIRQGKLLICVDASGHICLKLVFHSKESDMIVYSVCWVFVTICKALNLTLLSFCNVINSVPCLQTG